MSGAHRVLNRRKQRDGRLNRLTRRELLAGALALATTAVITGPVEAAGPAGDPFGGLLADPPEGPRFSLHLNGKEICSFETLRLRHLERAAQPGHPPVSLGWDDLARDARDRMDGGMPDKTDGDDADDDAPEPTAVLRDGTKLLPALEHWSVASRVASRQASGREARADSPARQDAVIVKLSAAGKVLERITLEDALVESLVLTPNQRSVDKLVLSFAWISKQTA